MTSAPQLCLGTVQFGLPYGITNNKGQVSIDEARKILNEATESGITFLDCAQAYGTAETILGECLPSGITKRLISKLPARSPKQYWETNLAKSLQRLNIAKLDSFLLHRPYDLLDSDGPELLDWLQSLRTRGLASRVGISIYEATELEGLPLRHLQVVQLPLSIYDQRMIQNGTIERLKDLGIAIHARSVFLQGLLLQPAKLWPTYLTKEFESHHNKWLKYLIEKGVTPLEAALAFVHECKGIEAVLVGVLSSKELRQVLMAWTQAKSMNSKDPEIWAWNNHEELDPRKWLKQ